LSWGGLDIDPVAESAVEVEPGCGREKSILRRAPGAL
jgi:hypothetical protein